MNQIDVQAHYYKTLLIVDVRLKKITTFTTHFQIASSTTHTAVSCNLSNNFSSQPIWHKHTEVTSAFSRRN